MLGVPEHSTSVRDRLVATAVSTIGIAIVVVVCRATRPDSSPASLWLVGSIGASAVLVFGVPHGPLSQPWAVLAGHGVSGLVGALTAHVLGGGTLAKALAVGLAIGAMHQLRCIHPPGGATSLAAVLMVAPGHDPSWWYPLSPVLLNAAVIVVAAVALNAPFRWRRYPLAFAFPRPAPLEQAHPDLEEDEQPFTAEQLETALAELDIVATISEDDLAAILRSIVRQQIADAQHLGPPA